MKLHGCRFLYFFSLYDVKNEAVFLELEPSSPRGVKQEKHKKKHEIFTFKPLLQEIWLKNLTSRKLFWSSTSKLQNKKKKPTAKACRNGAKLNYVHPTMVSSKIFDRSIYVIATWNSQEKIKWIIPHEQNHTPWLVKNSKTVFSKLMWQISLSVSGEQASRQANTSCLAFLSQIFIYFLIF